MTAAAISSKEPDDVVPFTGLEVATLASDPLRASMRVAGVLTLTSAPLLTSVLGTHVSAGRRYLRVDLATAAIADPSVVDVLVAAHRTITDLGGLLVFENAGPQVVDAIRTAHLFTTPSA